jgi:hypothetical protein
MDILSDWQLTFDPGGSAQLVILAYGDYIAEELSWPWHQNLQASAPTRATGRKCFARGAAESSLTITVFKDHADNAAARSWMKALQTTLNTVANVTSTAKLEVSGVSGYSSLSNAAVVSCVPRITPLGGVARTATTWTVSGGIWTAT